MCSAFIGVSDTSRPARQTLACFGCGALSVPRKKRGWPLVAAAATARRCSSRFRMGRQNACGRSPPCDRRSSRDCRLGAGAESPS